MDFINSLRHTIHYSYGIWVIVDRFTESAYLIRIQMAFNAERLAHIYVLEIVRLHGVPINIILDYGSTFTSRFCKVEYNLL